MEYKIVVKNLQVHESIGQWSNVVHTINCQYECKGDYTVDYLDFDCNVYDSASMSLDQVPGYVFTQFGDLSESQIVSWVEQSAVDFAPLQAQVSESVAVKDIFVKEVTDRVIASRPNLPWMQ
jgi:hypothetical protein